MTKKPLKDRKNLLGYAFLNVVNFTTLNVHFRNVKILGRWNIPNNEPFVLVANHSSRFDGLMVQHALKRPSNYMVSPNELKGLQGLTLPWVGAFPADPRLDLVGHAIRRFEKNEGLVVFPEGNVFYDGSTHAFKPGTARIILAARTQGIPVRVFCSAINYDEIPSRTASILIGGEVDVDRFVESFAEDQSYAVKALSSSLHREVCHLRSELGVIKDRNQVLIGRPIRRWVPAG